MEGWIGSSRVAFVSTFNKTGMSNGTPEKQLVTLIGILTTKCGHIFKLNLVRLGSSAVPLSILYVYMKLGDAGNS